MIDIYYIYDRYILYIYDRYILYIYDRYILYIYHDMFKNPRPPYPIVHTLYIGSRKRNNKAKSKIETQCLIFACYT